MTLHMTVACGRLRRDVACACSTAAQKGVASVAEIARRFDDNAAIFCSLLRSERLQGQTKGLEAIQQLLLRINFNRFYDRAPTGRT